MISSEVLELDYAEVEREIVSFIRRVVAASKARGAVLGLSGGIDSSVVGALCVRALGKGNVIGVLMPASHTPVADNEDARLLAKSWGIKTAEVPIDNAFEAVQHSIKVGGDVRIAQANAKARLRMIFLYYIANASSMVVAGTGDRSEDAIGFFTKWGDGGVDFLPISHLYKTQVRALGARLGIPDQIVSKPASPQLWPGHKATDEIPVDYDKLDLILYCLFDRKMTPGETSKQTGVDPELVESVVSRHKASEHKRVYPPMVKPW